MWSGRGIVGLVAVAAIVIAAAAAAHGASHSHDKAPKYTYHGCPLYAPNDWFTTNLVTGGSLYASRTVDRNSAAIIANLVRAFGTVDFSRDSPTFLEGVNLVNGRNRIATPLIENITYGFANNRYNDAPPPYRIEINSGRFMQEGTANCIQQGQDCHVNVLNTDKCVEYETYRSGGVSWDGVRYTAQGGGVENLRHPYQIQHIVVTAAHLAMMGTTDWGEDLAYQRNSCRPNCAIPHVVAFFLPKGSVATKGYVRPADGESLACTSGSYCNAYTLPLGARLRLKSSYKCPDPQRNPQANLLCNQAKRYGWIFNDFTGLDGGGGIRLGLSADASDPWRASDYNEFLSRVRLTDFDVMSLGTVQS